MLANDLPLLSWDDDKLFGRLAEIKKEFKWERNSLYKHLIHAINFGQKARGARDKIYEETGIYHSTSLLDRLMDLYRIDLFPSIPKWQMATQQLAHKQRYLRNAFGYIHYFYAVFDFKRHKIGDEFIVNSPAQAATPRRCWRSCRSQMLLELSRRPMLRLYYDRYEEAGQWLRLTVHDELMAECPKEKADSVVAVMEEEMSKPIPELAMPKHYNLGSHLSILVESKKGTRWSEMD